MSSRAWPRNLAWALVCLVAGGSVALGFYAAFWFLMLRRFPHLAEMKSGCGMGGAAVASAPAFATAATCQAYFGDLGLVVRTIVTDCVITGLLAAFILLVLRFRVYPLAAPGLPRPPG